MEDNRNQTQMDRGQSMQDQNMNSGQSNQQNSNNAEENSQDGRQWNNYRSRELSDNTKDEQNDHSTKGNL